MKTKDTYRTIEFATDEILLKEKSSKFYGYSFPLNTEEEVKSHIESLRKKHTHAVHFCYAFQIGTENIHYRVNDDGEPSSTAGMPIYGQIKSFELTNLLLVIVRIFGGTKLGVGGLISAYKTAAQMTLESASIIEKTIDIHYEIVFDYKNMNKVMRIIKERNIEILSQKMEINCEILISVRKKNAEIIFDIFDTMFEIKIRLINQN